MAHHPAGGHGSPDDEYAATPEGAAYEHTDAAAAPVAKFLIWLFVAALLTHVGLAGVYKLLIDQGVRQEASERRYPIAAAETPRLPPVPRLPHRRSDPSRLVRMGEQGGGYGADSHRRGHAPHRRAWTAGAGRGPGADDGAGDDAGRFEFGPDAGAPETVMTRERGEAIT